MIKFRRYIEPFENVEPIARLLEPLDNDPPDYLRIVDESGEDNLYPEIYFEIVQLNQTARNKLIGYFESVTV